MYYENKVFNSQYDYKFRIINLQILNKIIIINHLENMFDNPKIFQLSTGNKLIIILN